MNVLILNHCSHNKGDNSVLYYLTQCLDIVSDNNKVTVSCSDGSTPFWADKKLRAVYWPGGKIFKTPQVGFLRNAVRRLNFMLMRKLVYKVFLYCYSNQYDKLARFIAIAFFGSKLVEAYKEADKVICTGGHHISNVLEKDCVNPQLVSMALADLYGHNPVMWSQSIGPIDTASSISKIAIGRVFNSCSEIFVRDDLSESCVRDTSNAETTKAPDSVFLSNKLMSTLQEKVEKPYVCCAVYTAGITDEEYLSSYKASWVSICHDIIAMGLDVVFIPMQYKGFGGDEREFLSQIVDEIGNNSVSYVDDDKSPKETLKLFKGSSFIIGHKTHSVIYGLALEIPTIAIAYHEKTRYFMSLFGLDKYVFEDVIGNTSSIVSQVSNLTQNHQKQIHEKLKQSPIFASQLIDNLKKCFND